MKSGLLSSAPYCPPQDSSRSRATLPYELSLKTTATTLMPWRAAVESSCALKRKPPSPETETTGRSGRATLAPSATG